MVEACSEGADRRIVYRRVADLHVSCISQGFLATLGPQFLALMYEAIDEGPDSVLLVSKENGHIVGFVAASIGMKPVYRRMLRRLPRLLATLSPSLLVPSRVRRIIETVRYGMRESDPIQRLPQAELLSIGVAASFRGRGHAERLYRDLCVHFHKQGVSEFKIVVGASLQPAHCFYRRMNAVAAMQLEVHKGQPSIIYIHSVSSPNQ